MRHQYKTAHGIDVDKIFATFVGILSALGIFIPTFAHAIESASYSIISGYENPTSTDNAGLSTSFTIEDTQTWYQGNIGSTNYSLDPQAEASYPPETPITSTVVTKSTNLPTGGGRRHASAGTIDTGTAEVLSSQTSSVSSSSSVKTTTGMSDDQKSSTRSTSVTQNSAKIMKILTSLALSVSPKTAAIDVAETACSSLQFFTIFDDRCAMHSAPMKEGVRSLDEEIILKDGMEIRVIHSRFYRSLALIFGISWIASWYFYLAPKNRKKKKWLLITLQGIAIFLLLGLITSSAYAVAPNTVPKKHIYNGRLLNNTGNPITTPHNIRFSYWKNTDAIGTDILGSGLLNAAAPNYGGWEEVHTVTPNARGYFAVQLGSITPFPDYATMGAATLLSLYVQVEVKTSTQLDTSYEILDIDTTDPLVDRSPVLSVPFSINAEYLNLRHIGTGSGNIVLLESGGLLPTSATPSKSNRSEFVLDADNNGTGSLVLQFGATLAKKLSYSLGSGTFIFNDDLQVQGNLQVTGLINGVNIAALQGNVNLLKASTGGGLSVNVTSGNYRLGSSIVSYAGGSIAITDNSTNYIYFDSTGLTHNTTGFDTTKNYIPIATAVTSGGAVTTITDMRIASEDDRQHNEELIFTPEFERASYSGDGTQNVGQLRIQNDGPTLSNYYNWMTTKPTLQDYSVTLDVPLSKDFTGWQSGTKNPLSLQYRTSSALATDNALDISVFDTSGTPVALSGSTTGLANTAWSTAEIEYTGSPTWTPGEAITVRISLSARSSFEAHLGSITLRTIQTDE